MVNWHICKADRTRLKWTIRGELFNGDIVKIPAHRDRKVSLEMMRHVEQLDRAVRLGLPPLKEQLDWVVTLPPKDANRLIAHGLVDRAHLDQRLPINELIDLFDKDLKSFCKRGSTYPRLTVGRVRRLVERCKVASYRELTEMKIKVALNGIPVLHGPRKNLEVSSRERGHHIFAIKRFCDWMIKTGRSSAHPALLLKAPSKYADPVVNRRPLEVSDFEKLLNFLRGAKAKYKHQRAAWTPRDRAMLYWAAVTTGFRKKELSKLTRAHFNFDMTPARLRIDGWIAKTGLQASIPLPDDFARAMREYTAHLLPAANAFCMPSNAGWVTEGFYRDMDSARIERTFDDGDRVDFHTLRSTAIYWWIKVMRLDLLSVQFMARLNTLELVGRYVRRWVPNYSELVANAPRFEDPLLPYRRAS